METNENGDELKKEDLEARLEAASSVGAVGDVSVQIILKDSRRWFTVVSFCYDFCIFASHPQLRLHSNWFVVGTLKVVSEESLFGLRIKWKVVAFVFI